MPDMLVKLYELPPLEPEITRQENQGVLVRRALAPEQGLVQAWVAERFGTYWHSECGVAFSRLPVSCFIAIEAGKLIGFGCYDTTMRGFFGPTGVDEAERGRGIGRALLLACLHAMYEIGYGYAIIGAAGPTDFYTKAVGAKIIEGSVPGIYRELLRRPES